MSKVTILGGGSAYLGPEMTEAQYLPVFGRNEISRTSTVFDVMASIPIEAGARNFAFVQVRFRNISGNKELKVDLWRENGSLVRELNPALNSAAGSITYGFDFDLSSDFAAANPSDIFQIAILGRSISAGQPCYLTPLLAYSYS